MSRRFTQTLSDTQMMQMAIVNHHPFRKRFHSPIPVNHHPPADDSEDQIEISCSPIAKVRRHETGLVVDCSPYKRTPQKQLVSQIASTNSPIAISARKYESNPAIEIVSPLKYDPNQVIEKRDSRQHQLKKESKSRQKAIRLFDDAEKGAAIFAHQIMSILEEHWLQSGRERGSFLSALEDVDEENEDGVKSHSQIDVIIFQTTFSEFGKCIVDGHIVKAIGFNEEEKFELEEQRVRLMIDADLGNSLTCRLETGRQIRIYSPFTLIQDNRSDFIMQDFFFIRALDSVPSHQLQSDVILKWDCPCRVTDTRLNPEVTVKACKPQKHK